MSESKLPSGIDKIVGQRVRWRRRELKLTQEKLGELLNLTFQQVQKYEKGVNRISAGRLFEVAHVLAVPIDYFYEGAKNYLAESGDLVIAESAETQAIPVMTGDVLELVTAFEKIENQDMRRLILENVRSLAELKKSE